MRRSLRNAIFAVVAVVMLWVPAFGQADPPQPVWPAYDSEDNPLTVQFRWQADIPNLFFYELLVSKNFVFADTVFHVTLVRDTITYPGLEVGTIYFWKVRALYNRYIGGGTWLPTYTDWSIQFYFKTCDYLGLRYVLTSPSDGAVDLTEPVYFAWAGVENANRYYLQVDDGALFLSPEIDRMLGAIGGNHYNAYGLEEGTTYYWRVKAVNTCFDGGWSYVRSFTMASPTDVTEIPSPELPEAYELGQNYPNPFNMRTSIEFSLPRAGHITVDVFNVLGRKVRTLVDEHVSAGRKLLTWDGRDDGDTEVSSGLYFYRLTTDGFQQTRKMTLLK